LVIGNYSFLCRHTAVAKLSVNARYCHFHVKNWLHIVSRCNKNESALVKSSPPALLVLYVLIFVGICYDVRVVTSRKVLCER
jgi:hypothetical protein